MEKYIFFLVSLYCALLPAIADQPEHPEPKASDANIIGHIFDRKMGRYPSYITITLKGTTIGTVTDATGRYLPKDPPGEDFVFEASSAGCRAISHNVTPKKGKTLEENFELEEDAVTFDGVVVSANRSVTKRRLAPTPVNVVGARMFEDTNSPTLSQRLNFQPGVCMETNCQSCRLQQVRISGLDGPYTQILTDSRPVFSAFSGICSLGRIPVNMIERVEVMRGGGSALFGSFTTAGTINITVKESLRSSGQLVHTIISIDDSSSFDNNTSLGTSLMTDDHRAGLYVFGQNQHHDAYDHDGGSYSEMPKLKSQTIDFHSLLKTGTYSKLTFEYRHLQESHHGDNTLNRPPHEVGIAERIQHSINGGGSRSDCFAPDEKHRLTLYTSAQHTDHDSYYDSKKDLNAYGKTTGLIFIGSFQHVYSFDKCLFMPADLTAGLKYNRDNLRDDMWGYNRYTRQTVDIDSAFFQNERKNKEWSILLGGCLDKHNLTGHVVFSPHTNLRFNPTQDVSLRLSYSSGFRAPRAFDENLYIENVDKTVSMIEHAKNLKEEKSQSFSVSADTYHRFDAFQMNFLVEGFYTKLSDVLILENIGVRGGILIKECRNGSGAKVLGLSMEGKMTYLPLFQLQAGATLRQSHYDEPEKWSETAPTQKKIFHTPSTYGYFTAAYTPVKPLSVPLPGTYTGSILAQHTAGYIENDVTVNTRDLFDMGVKLVYNFKPYKTIDLQLGAGVQNMFNVYQDDFDQGMEHDSGYIYGLAVPRSYFAGVKANY